MGLSKRRQGDRALSMTMTPQVYEGMDVYDRAGGDDIYDARADRVREWRRSEYRNLLDAPVPDERVTA